MPNTVYADARRSPARRLARWQLRDLAHAARIARAAGACSVTTHGVTCSFRMPVGAEHQAEQEAVATKGAEAAPPAVTAETGAARVTRPKRQQRSDERLQKFLEKKRLHAEGLVRVRTRAAVRQLQQRMRLWLVGRLQTAEQTPELRPSGAHDEPVPHQGVVCDRVSPMGAPCGGAELPVEKRKISFAAKMPTPKRAAAASAGRSWAQVARADKRPAPPTDADAAPVARRRRRNHRGGGPTAHDA